ncbi:hypothetical protein EDC01DRAFT_117529 [Geopyxis carbonaria]|nr:hypothetical protein EDC01DRAFT_117529 [Geopyxis carbonaria]
MVLADSKNRVGLGRALMNSRGGTGGTRTSRVGRGRGKGPIEQVFTVEKKEAEWFKIRSITEQNDLDEFLATAELADTDFSAEKMNIQIVHKDQQNPYLLSADDEKAALKKQNAHRRELTVPRRPAWDSTTTPAELDQRERESFLAWRRNLADLQDNQDLMLTPFERNLEVWRQLWRVIERSDLVVQIVDARNPLLFRCEDLDKYVKEVDQNKNNLLLINKADLMTIEQRTAWADYFDEQGVRYRFFSAALAKEINEMDSEDEEDEEEEDEEEEEEQVEAAAKSEDAETALAEETEKLEVKDKWVPAEVAPEEEESPRTRIITVDELEGIFLEHAPEGVDAEHKTTIGLVGYPNVGKSSTINALMGAKKVSVSATPGKTKHFQTLHLSERLLLCDCPGLVFPNFATTKGELVCNGVLPIDQQREYTGPSTLVAQRIPQWYLERLYGIKIITRPLEEGGTGIPTGEEMLVAYARARGFFKTGAGNPDDSRAARYVLKDYVNGKLLFCHPPPTDPPTDALAFNSGLYADDHLLPAHRRAAGGGPGLAGDDEPDMVPFIPEGAATRQMDSVFFARDTDGGKAHVKTPFARPGLVATPVSDSGRMLSGRKAKTVVALDNRMSHDDVRGLMGGGKKHFKGGKKERKKLGMEV